MESEDAKQRTLRELHAFERSKAEAARSFEQKLSRFAATLTPDETESFAPLLSELAGNGHSRQARPVEPVNTRRQSHMTQRNIDVRINDVPEEGVSEYLVSVQGDNLSVRRLGTSADAHTAYLKPMQKADDVAYLKPMQKADDAAYLKPMQKQDEEPLSLETLSRRIEELRNSAFSRGTAPVAEQRAVRRLQELTGPEQARPAFAVSWSSCESQSCHPG